jgi:DNA-directed RNA polymerase subunit RPC12/RpoP
MSDPSTDPQRSEISNWKPPANFQAVPSRVRGVSVYSPRPQEKLEDKQKNYICPHCGATTQYDVASGGIACEYCGYQVLINSDQVGKNAGRNEFTLEILDQNAKGWGIKRDVLSCENCGAELSIPATSLTATCPFCASNKVNINPIPSEQLRPRYLIPFTILPDSLHASLSKWLGQGWFYPGDLKTGAMVDKFTGVYLPFWTFGAVVTSDWEADVGYEKQENYYDDNSRSWKARTVIEWRHEKGNTEITVENLLVTGSKKISELLLNKIQPYNLNQLVAYSPDYLAGWQAQSYEIPLDESWDKARITIREKAKTACREDISSSHVKNFAMNADLANETWRLILLPVYIASYAFNQKVYHVMVNGQSGLVAGQKPVEWWKIWLAISAVLLPGILIGLISLPLIAIGGIGILTCSIALILLVIGAVLSVKFYKQAIESEAV